MVETRADRRDAPASPAEQPGRYDVFLSYARVDLPAPGRLAEALEAREKEVWLDVEDILGGADWEERIRRGIEACRAFVIYLSPSSVASPYCAFEVEQAEALNKLIIPAHDGRFDGRGAPESLRRREWVVVGADGAGLDHLIEALETDLPWRDQHTRLAVKAREWLGGHDRSLLLRGADLRKAEQWLDDAGEHRQSPTPEQQEYIRGSRSAASRRLQAALATALAALAVAVGLTIFALVQRHEAVQQSHTARSRELAALADAQLSADPQLSVLLAAAGARVAPTRQAVTALRTALAASHLQALVRMPVAPLGPPAVSADGRYLLQGGRDGAGRVWDLRSGAVQAVLRPARLPPLQADYYDRGPDFSSALGGGGRWAATVSSDGVLRVWDWRRDGAQVAHRLVGKTHVAFSPDGRLLAAAADVGRVFVWDWRSGRKPVRLPGTALYNRVAFDPSGRYLVAGGLQGSARVWDVATRTQLAQLGEDVPPSNGDPIDSVAFSSDGRYVLTGTDSGTVSVWDWRLAARVGRLAGAGGTASAVFGTDPRVVLVATADGKVRVWDWVGNRELGELRGHRGRISGIATDRAGRVYTTGSDGTLRVWRTAPLGAQLPDPHETFVTSVAFSPQGRVVAAAGSALTSGAAQTVDVVDLGRRRPVETLRGPPTGGGDYAPWLRVRFSRDGRIVAGASDAGVADVWTLGHPDREVQLRHGQWVGAVALSPDGRLLATTGQDRVVRVWRWRGRAVVTRLRLPGRASTAYFPGRIDFSPDGALLAVADADTVQVWDWRRGRAVARLRSPADVADVRFDRSGARIAVAGGDGAARVWDWRHGATLAVLQAGAAVTSVDFSRDGGLVLTGDGDGAATIWDWAAEQPVESFREPSRQVADSSGPAPDPGLGDARFSADARSIVTAGADGRARLYACDVCGPLPELLRLARQRGVRALTAEERSRYLDAG